MTISIIASPRLTVGKNGISLCCFLEFFFGLIVIRISIRMMLHGQLTIGAFEFLVAHTTGNAKYFVVVSLAQTFISTSPFVIFPVG